MIDGPNATGYDNSVSPNPLYVLATTVAGPAVEREGTQQPIVNQCIIGSDPIALAAQGARMKESFAANKIEAELFYRVVQAG